MLYLANFNNTSGEDLTPIGSTAIYPLGLYSQKYDSVDAIPDGSTVLVPNDDTNRARALGVLESAGLIKLTGEWTLSTRADDIDEGSSKVKVTEVDAAQTAAGLPDAAAAVINNDFIDNAGLGDSPKPIAQDDPSSDSAKPYVNVWVARSEDKDNETYKKLVEIFQDTASVQEGVKEASGDTAVLVKDTPESLQDLLSKTQEQLNS